MIDLIFLFAAMLLPIMVICKVFENSYDERVNSKEFVHRKKHDYYINKFLNYTPLEIKND
jgi:hypothetical protein